MKSHSSTPRQPLISWGYSHESDNHFCSVCIPRAWLMETSHLKRRLQLWWWLTKLTWSLPR